MLLFRRDTANRRRGQALVSLIVGRAEASGSATTTPLVNLVIGQRILENLLERFLDPHTPAVPVDRDDPDYRCETIAGTPIHPDLAFVAAAVAEFERIVLDERSRVIDMSVKARGFPDWMKRALLIEARAMMPFGLASQVQPEFAVRQTRYGQVRQPTDAASLAQPNSGLPGNARQYRDLVA